MFIRTLPAHHSAVLFCLVTTIAWAEQAAPPRAADTNAIRGWVHTPSAEEFQERETAKRELLRAGQTALPALETAASGDDRKQSECCLHTISALARCDDRKSAPTADGANQDFIGEGPNEKTDDSIEHNQGSE